MAINLKAIADLLQPPFNGLDPNAVITVDYDNDRLLFAGEPFFSRQEIESNTYKKEAWPRALKILNIDDEELKKRTEAMLAAWAAR